MLKTKESTGSQKEMNLTEQNYRKVFKNVENLFTNDNAKKKAIKYVIQIGRKKQNDRENNKIEYTNMNLNTTRSKNISNINYIQKRYKTLENEESQQDINYNEISLSNEYNNNNLNLTERNKINQIPNLNLNNINNRMSKSLEKRNIREKRHIGY